MVACSILLAETSARLREKLASVLVRMDAIWCVTAVKSAAGLLRAAAELKPELILVDWALLREAGLVESLRAAAPASRVLGLVDDLSEEHLRVQRRLRIDGVAARSGALNAVLARIPQESPAGGTPLGPGCQSDDPPARL